MSILSSRRRLAGLLALVFAGTALAQGDPSLTLERALQLAEQGSPQLAAQDAARQAAREMAVAADQLPDPALKAGINNLPVDGADRFSLTRDFMTMRSVGLMQELTRADKRRARAARFEREADAAQAAKMSALAALRRETAKAWFELHFQQRLGDMLLAQRREAALQVDAVEAAHRGGRASPADVFAARAAVAQVDERLALAAQLAAVATARLARWIGDDARRPLAAAPPLPPLDSAAFEARIALHPEITLLARQEDVVRADVDVAARSRDADWSVELMVSQRGSAYSNMVSVNVSIPLQWDRANRQDRELAAKLALVDKARAEREEAMRERRAEALAALLAWQGQRERIALYDRTLLPLASQRTQAALAAYRGGGPLGAVLEARRMEIDARIEQLRLEMEAAALWAQLAYLWPPEQAFATRKE